MPAQPQAEAEPDYAGLLKSAPAPQTAPAQPKIGPETEAMRAGLGLPPVPQPRQERPVMPSRGVTGEWRDESPAATPLASTGRQVAGMAARMAGGVLESFGQVGRRIERGIESPELRRRMGLPTQDAGAPGEIRMPPGGRAADELRYQAMRGDEAYEQTAADVLRQGGVPARIAYDIATGAWQTAAQLLVSKAVTGALPGGMTGAGKPAMATIEHAAKFAAWSYARTPGDENQKKQAAATAFFYVATPAVSSGASSDALAKLLDFALNSGITVGTGQYTDAWQRAQAMAAERGESWDALNTAGKAKYLAATASQAALSDLLFSMGTKSRNPRLREFAAQNPDVNREIERTERAAAEYRAAKPAIEIVRADATVSEPKRTPFTPEQLARATADMETRTTPPPPASQAEPARPVGEQTTPADRQPAPEPRQQIAPPAPEAATPREPPPPADDLAGMDRRALAAEAKRLGVPVKGKNDALRDGIRHARAAQQEPAPAARPPDIKAMPRKDLIEYARANHPGLDTKGGTAVIRERVRKAEQTAAKEGIVSDAEQRAGYPLRTKEGKWRSGLTLTTRADGKSYAKPIKVELLGVVDENTVTIRHRQPGTTRVIVEQVPIIRISEPGAAARARERNEALSALPPAERRQVEADARAFDRALLESPLFTGAEQTAKIETAVGPRGRALAISQHMRNAREEAARQLGVSEGDMDNPRVRAELLPRIQELIQARAGSAALEDAKDYGSQQPQRVPTYEFIDGDLVFKNGEWLESKQNAQGDRLLEDGAKLKLDDDGGTDVAVIVRPGDPEYAQALAEFREQQARIGKQPSATAERFALEQQTPDQVDAERAAQSQAQARADMAERQAAPLRGTAGDVTVRELPGMESELPLAERAQAPAARAETPDLATMDRAALVQYAKQNFPDLPTTGGAQVLRERITAAQQAAKPPAERAAEAIKPSARDYAAEADARQRGGYVDMLPAKPMARRMRKAMEFLRSEFSSTAGVDQGVYGAYLRMQSAIEAGRWFGKSERNLLSRQATAIAKQSGADRVAVLTDMAAVQEGAMTGADFAAKYRLPGNHAAVNALEVLRIGNETRAQLIANAPGLPEALRRTLMDNSYYQTRKLERWMMGDDFVPKPEDYRAAIAEVERAQVEAIDALSVRIAAAQGQRKPFDIARYLETGDAALLSGLSQSRADAAQSVRDQYNAMREMLELVADKNGVVEARPLAEEVARVAKNIVDYHLEKGGDGSSAMRGGVDVSNLQSRVLEGAFLRLYGEVRDPSFRQAFTTEVQTKLLAQQTFFNEVAKMGAGSAWSYKPDPTRGLVVRLGSSTPSGQDRMRYGDLAGTFVTREFYDLINPAGRGYDRTYKIVDAMWYRPMATMRLLKLINPKTIVRNYVTAFTGFSLGNGDAFLPTYYRHFGRAHSLLTRVIRNDPAALREIGRLAESDVFRSSASSATYDLMAFANQIKGPSALLRPLGSAYAFIDFPTKYAAYMARMDAGMTPEQAAAHVRAMYQYRDFTPKVVGALTRSGLADYTGYLVDSMRITKNQVAFAAQSARNGDLRPLMGFIMSRAMHLAAKTTKLTLLATTSWAALHRAIRQEDEDVEESETLPPDRQVALRSFLPRYYQDAPLTMWHERKRDGTDALYYTVVGGQTAWPAEDWMIGALQASRAGGAAEFQKAMVNAVQEQFGVGMMGESVWRFLTGDELSSPVQRKGIMDVLQKEDPDKARIFARSVGQLALDVYTGRTGPDLARILQKRREEEAGQQPIAGTYASARTAEDIALGSIALLRTYRVDKPEMARMIKYAARRYGDGIQAAKAKQSAANSAIRTRGAAMPDQLAEAERGQAWRIDKLREMQGMIARARLVNDTWFSDEELIAILSERDVGLSKDEAAAVIGGTVDQLPEYDPQVRRGRLEALYNLAPQASRSAPPTPASMRRAMSP